MTTMTLIAHTTPMHVNRNTGDPLVLGVCSEIARSLRLPIHQVRLVAAGMIAASLVIPGLVAYAVLGMVLRSRRRFGKAHPCNPALDRANDVLEAYLAEKRAPKRDAASPANGA